ncbi:hypothetical protein [Nostoc sp.]|uniref:hypothetical protein n=1 Tax=Nostoc sp. TaxID=1180 RepID=UPI002FFBAA1F
MLCWQVTRSLLNSNHNFLFYHNQLICLAAIAKKYLSLQKFTTERLTILALSVAVRILHPNDRSLWRSID